MSDKSCATCLHYSKKDKCCALHGETREKDGEACGQYSNGAVGVRKKRKRR